MGRKLLAVLFAMTLVAVVACSQNRPADSEPAQGSLPTAVKRGFDQEYPEATIKDVERQELPDGSIRYNVSLTTRDGKDVKAVFDSTGKKRG